MPSVVSILGMHRSGTSLTARWLSVCGLELGKRLIGGTLGNKDGHYEDLDFHDFHEDVFRVHKVPYGGLQHMPSLKLDRYFQSRLKAMIGYKDELHTHWGWKEPRTCLFLDYYRKLLPKGINLVLFRPCSEVVSSLWNRKQKERGMSLKIEEAEKATDLALINDYTEAWIQYNENILRHLSELPESQYYVTNLYELKQEWEGVIDWINESGFGLQKVDYNTIFENDMLTATKSPDLRNLLSPSQLKRIELITKSFHERRFGREELTKLGGQLFAQYREGMIASNRSVQILEQQLELRVEQLKTELQQAEQLKIESLKAQLLKLNEQGLEQLCIEKDAHIKHLEEMVQSAQDWQNNWKNKIFHKWRPQSKY